MSNIIILEKREDGRENYHEADLNVTAFEHVFALHKFGSFYTARPEVALEIAQKYYLVNLSELDGFKFRSADNITEFEVTVV